ncbi:hypothetical protein [Phormidium tenue]|uniref:DUF676 domain-containing protein n=1 Tax=Phormidium tenue NIES-30 TaxID=549789 RepID=A0A1U7JA87_9CYAN|nr:hypothetical protein [Phormidium tenue]MBD2230537.1 hypothetical protein [Phormidium tenue FACHB-1052]OKH50687.1 hypothetical protein NIES30_00905 [Phormidium tenue NIES-30]
MLVFFIHGVATRDVKYSNSLIEGIKKEFNQIDQKLPYFYTSFWGHVLNDFNKIWNHIDEDLHSLEKRNPGVNAKESFRYRQFREGLISEFAGDMFTYMNEKQGREVRQLIADQLLKFVEKHPDEEEIHIIAHSLGTVILWDILFSDKFEDGDPAHVIRSIISKQGSGENTRRVSLSSITTMGSPILFFNAMLGINAKDIERKIRDYTSRRIKWLNVVHASDIIAYPLSTSLNLSDKSNLVFRDQFICKDANLLETAARKINQQEVALIASTVDAHNSYWTLHEVSQSISNQVTSQVKFSERIVLLLKKVPGMSQVGIKLHSNKDVVDTIRFKDRSGRLKYFKNFAGVYHIYVYNASSECVFSGFVNWSSTDLLLEEIEYIRWEFGES